MQNIEEKRAKNRERVARWRKRQGYSAGVQSREATARWEARKKGEAVEYLKRGPKRKVVVGAGVKVDLELPPEPMKRYGELSYERCDDEGRSIGGGLSGAGENVGRVMAAGKEGGRGRAGGMVETEGEVALRAGAHEAGSGGDPVRGPKDKEEQRAEFERLKGKYGVKVGRKGAVEPELVL